MRAHAGNDGRVHVLRMSVAAFVACSMLLAVAIAGGAPVRNAWADDVQGADIGDTVTSVTIQKKTNGQWQDTTEVTTDDDIRAKVEFKDADTALIKNSGNKAYVKIGGPIDCSSYLGKTYALHDAAYEASHSGRSPGTYSYVKRDDGWYVVMSFDDDYLQYAGSTVDGTFNLNMDVAKDQYPDDGKTETVKVGNGEGTLTIKPGKSSEADQDANYNLSKTASALRYSEDGKTAYYDYTVTLTVNKDMPGPINMTDTLTGKGWNYVDGSWKIVFFWGGVLLTPNWIRTATARASS